MMPVDFEDPYHSQSSRREGAGRGRPPSEVRRA
jgi:hypothetical protein